MPNPVKLTILADTKSAAAEVKALNLTIKEQFASIREQVALTNKAAGSIQFKPGGVDLGLKAALSSLKTLDLGIGETRKNLLGLNALRLGGKDITAGLFRAKEDLQEVGSAASGARTRLLNLGKVRVNFGEVVQGSGTATAEINTVSQAVRNARREISIFAEARARNARLFAVGGLLGTAGYGLRTGGQAMTQGYSVPVVQAAGYAVKKSIDYESDFANVAKTVGGSPAELKALRAELEELSTQVPQTFKEITDIASTVGQLGVARDQVKNVTKDIIELHVATKLSTDTGAMQMVKFANSIGLPADQIGRLGSVISELDKDSKATSNEVLSMALRIGGVGHIAGLTGPQILAFANAFAGVGVRAQQGGSAISTAIIQINRAVRTGGQKLDEFANVAGMSSDQFKKAFKENAAGALSAFIEGLGRLHAAHVDVLPVMDALGLKSKLEIDAMTRASGAGDALSKALGRVDKAYADNTATGDRYRKATDNTKAKLIELQNAANNAAAKLGDSLIPVLIKLEPDAEKLLGTISRLIDDFDKLPEPVKETALEMLALSVAAGPVIEVIGGVVTIGGAVIRMFAAFKALRAGAALAEVAEEAGTAEVAQTAFAASGASLLSKTGLYGLAIAGVIYDITQIKQLWDMAADAQASYASAKIGDAKVQSGYAAMAASPVEKKALAGNMAQISGTIHSIQDEMAALRFGYGEGDNRTSGIQDLQKERRRNAKLFGSDADPSGQHDASGPLHDMLQRYAALSADLAKQQAAYKLEKTRLDTFSPPSNSAASTGKGSGSSIPGIDRWNDVISRVGAEQGVSPAVIKAIIHNESGGNPLATNHNRNGTTDYGIMQVNSATKDPNSYNWRDPYQNMLAGVTEFKEKLRQAGGDLREGFRRYNGRGPAAEAYADRAMAFLGTRGGATPSASASRVPFNPALFTSDADSKKQRALAYLNTKTADSLGELSPDKATRDKAEMETRLLALKKAGASEKVIAEERSAWMQKITHDEEEAQKKSHAKKEAEEKRHQVALAELRRGVLTLRSGMQASIARSAGNDPLAEKIEAVQAAKDRYAENLASIAVLQAKDGLKDADPRVSSLRSLATTDRDAAIHRASANYTKSTGEAGEKALEEAKQQAEEAQAYIKQADADTTAMNRELWQRAGGDMTAYFQSLAKEADDTLADAEAKYGPKSDKPNPAALTAATDQNKARHLEITQQQTDAENAASDARQQHDLTQGKISLSSYITYLTKRRDAYQQYSAEWLALDNQVYSADEDLQRKQLDAAEEMYRKKVITLTQYQKMLADLAVQVPLTSSIHKDVQNAQDSVQKVSNREMVGGEDFWNDMASSASENGSKVLTALFHPKNKKSIFKSMWEDLMGSLEGGVTGQFSKMLKNLLTGDSGLSIGGLFGGLFGKKKKADAEIGVTSTATGASSSPSLFSVPSVSFGSGSGKGLSGNLLGAMPLLNLFSQNRALVPLHGINGPLGGGAGGAMDIASLAASFLPGGSLLGKLFGGGGRGLFGGLKKLLHFSAGGIVPGRGDRDSVHAMLTPGEIVIPKALSSNLQLAAHFQQAAIPGAPTTSLMRLARSTAASAGSSLSAGSSSSESGTGPNVFHQYGDHIYNNDMDAERVGRAIARVTDTKRRNMTPPQF